MTEKETEADDKPSKTDNLPERTMANRKQSSLVIDYCPSSKSGMKSSSESVIRDEELSQEAKLAFETLQDKYGMDAVPQRGDHVVVMEGWNKCLAFKTSFAEALTNRWRLLVEIQRVIDDQEAEEQGEGNMNLQGGRKGSLSESIEWGPHRIVRDIAVQRLDDCKDLLAVRLGPRLENIFTMIVGMLDGIVRGLCPHTQRVQPEAYRPIIEDFRINDAISDSFGFTGGTKEEYFRNFARCGLAPNHWVLFCEAFLWAMQTHSPYANEFDHDDLAKPYKTDSIYANFVATHVAKPAIEAHLSLRSRMNQPNFQISVVRFWAKISHRESEKMASLCETFYQELLAKNPHFLDYFVKSDMDSLAKHLFMTLEFLVETIHEIGFAGQKFRSTIEHLGEIHRRQKIPTGLFPIVGGQLIKTLQPLFEEEEEETKHEDYPTKAAGLGRAFAVLYKECMWLIAYPMYLEEKLSAEATEFLTAVAKELNWSPIKLKDRLLEVNVEIFASGSYSHTSEELEIGARLAWRSSAKCIGRIAWNTLMVRDCRHVSSPKEIFREVEEHLRLATCGTNSMQSIMSGTNIQSVMTVFRPRSPGETWGLRFWSSQFVRYAGYKLEEGESHKDANADGVVGDPANVDFTNYLRKRRLWRRPNEISAFDVLPIVLKIPGVQRPFVYQLPDEFVREVRMEHPKCPAFEDLGLRWPAVPAIADFNMNLGGINYNCAPFNGWFVSIEIVRNLMERYKVAPRIIETLQLDASERMVEMRVQHELQIAVLHSFDKNGFSIVDPASVGKSFLVHCSRERDVGRECPAQWSWIGGLVGPTNVTWHHEMRDFYVAPQYEYASHPYSVIDISAFQGFQFYGLDESHHSQCDSIDDIEAVRIPKVLILFGSQTGTAEAAAFKLKKVLRVLNPILMSLNDAAGLKIVDQRNITHIFAICSTFNRGDFPSNATEFTSLPLPNLDGVKVAVLALGSTMYPDYCMAGIELNKALHRAGSQSLMSITQVDDTLGTSHQIDEWVKLAERLVLPKHLAAVISKRGTSSSPPQHSIRWLFSSENTHFDMHKVFRWPEQDSCPCVGNIELMEEGNIDTRSTRCITFQLPSGKRYKSGDHLSVTPLNSLKMVKRFAACFTDELLRHAMESRRCPCLHNREEAILWQLQQPVSLETNDNGDIIPAQVCFSSSATLYEALQSTIDLSVRETQVADFVELVETRLAIITSNEPLGPTEAILRNKLDQVFDKIKTTGDARQDGIAHFLSLYPTFVDFLEEYASLLCSESSGPKGEGPLLKLVDMLTFLPRIRDRYYSISSSPYDKSSQVSISVGVVHVQTKADVPVHGVCSNYLARLQPNLDRALISVRSSSFRGPKSQTGPVIMVGCGTGLAPMMGFLKDRSIAEDVERGPCHLFFGCRDLGDRIYAKEIDTWHTLGILELHLALSQAPNTPKTYVQTLLRKQGETICSLLLQADTHYYVCGDARVASECVEACIQILSQHGKMSRMGALHYLRQMKAEQRWQQDLWGTFEGLYKDEQDTIVKARKRSASAMNMLLSFADVRI